MVERIDPQMLSFDFHTCLHRWPNSIQSISSLSLHPFKKLTFNQTLFQRTPLSPSVCSFMDSLLVLVQSLHGPLGLAHSVLDKQGFLLLPRPLESLTPQWLCTDQLCFHRILNSSIPPFWAWLSWPYLPLLLNYVTDSGSACLRCPHLGSWGQRMKGSRFSRAA